MYLVHGKDLDRSSTPRGGCAHVDLVGGACTRTHEVFIFLHVPVDIVIIIFNVLKRA